VKNVKAAVWERASALTMVKVLHTAVWAVMVALILLVPLTAWTHRWALTAWFSGVVWVECAVIAVNRWKCPLTHVAERFTADRRPNFDIYLPEWLARENQVIFGSLFGFSELVSLTLWIWRR
jgi:hypothetical protein